MSGTFPEALTVQGRVLWALALRELHGMHGDTRLGYIWQFIKVGSSIAIFWGIRSFLGRVIRIPMDLPMPVFLLTGFIPWYMFSAFFKNCMEAGRTNRSLLRFPQITILDIQLGSAILVVYSHVVVFLLFLALYRWINIPWELRNPMGLLTAILALSAFSFGLGLVLAVAKSFFPILEKVVPLVMRVMFFTSGIFFPLTRFAKSGMVMEILNYNPILNYIELFRSCFLYPEFPSLRPDVTVWFPLAAATLAAGLCLERAFRDRLIRT